MELPNITLDKFKDFFRYYAGTPKQDEALEILYKAMPTSLLEDDTRWIVTYRTPEKEVTPEIPEEVIELICEFEGFRPEVYECPAGIATIGYGSTFYESGVAVRFGDAPISEARAKNLMRGVCNDFWRILEKTIPYWSEMNNYQRGCLLSFGYNVGVDFYNNENFETITYVLSDRDYERMDYALHLYINPGTAAEYGLIRRRDAEYAMWCKECKS